jgi:hypothetical protein
MSNAHIEIVGLERLQKALDDAPEAVDVALSIAADDAIAVLGPSIDSFTPVRTGLLRSQNELFEVPGFRVLYSNFTPYAVFVNASQQFLERGVEAARSEVEDVYEQAIDELARDFGSDV